MRTNIHGNTQTNIHTHKHTHNARHDKRSNIYTEAHTHTAHTHARAQTVRQDKGSDTLAELRCYVFKHNGSAFDTCAGKNTHARAHREETISHLDKQRRVVHFVI